MSTGIVTHPLYLEHFPGPGHPESPSRLKAILGRLEQDGLLPRLKVIEPRPASASEIQYIHTPELYKLVGSTSGHECVYIDGDTATSSRSFEAALLGAGGVICLVDAIAGRGVQNGFALVRPPGHHAEPDRAMGFCLFNNIAIGAQHAVKNLGMHRILIVDWDLHHGNGTQEVFYARKDVLYFSTHQFPHYPGTGSLRENGAGDGEGYSVNVPLPAGCGDEEYVAVFKEVLEPIADEFAPELILVSAGFDSHGNDPLGGMRVSEDGFRSMASILCGIAARHSEGRICFVLEGGYDLDGLARSCTQTIGELLAETRTQVSPVHPGKFREFLDKVRHHYVSYWKKLE